MCIGCSAITSLPKLAQPARCHTVKIVICVQSSMHIVVGEKAPMQGSKRRNLRGVIRSLHLFSSANTNPECGCTILAVVTSWRQSLLAVSTSFDEMTQPSRCHTSKRVGMLRLQPVNGAGSQWCRRYSSDQCCDTQFSRVISFLSRSPVHFDHSG